MSYKIGIDGGGTKTEYALFADSPRPLLTYSGPRSNHEVLPGGIPEAAETLHAGISRLLETARLSLKDIRGISMGIAGMDRPGQILEMKGRLSRYGIEDPYICNDGFLIVKAGSPGGYGIGYNAGTGTCCNAIYPDGSMIQLGGFGDFSGDTGNANWNAIRTFRAVYDDAVLHLKNTRMTERYLRAFHIHTPEELIDSIGTLQSGLNPDAVPLLNTILFEGFREKDPAALCILEEITERASDFISCLAKEFPAGDAALPVILAGSVHEKQAGPAYLSTLTQKIQTKSNRKISLHILDRRPVIGAFYL